MMQSRNSSRLSPFYPRTVGFLVLLALAGGCEEQNLGPLDPAGSPPFIRSFRVTPDSVSLNTLTPSGGQYAINLQCTAEVTDPDGPSTPGTVTADVLAPGGTEPVATLALSTDSTRGNVSSLSGAIHFSVTKSAIGVYRVVLHATDNQSLSSNSVDRRLMIWRTNAPPALSSLVAPDTLILPTGGTVTIPMSVTATDSNGLSDVAEVFFRSLDSSDPTTKYMLYDNGNASNGDATAGDGKFSIIIQLTDGPNVRRTFRFAFQAIDASADTSAILLHSLTVR
jgi:hypothetical protein